MAAKETQSTSQDMIQSHPGVCGGNPCIRGARIPVWSVVESWRRGVSEDDLQNYFTTPLTAAEVRAALEFYQDHREEIEEEIRANEEA